MLSRFRRLPNAASLNAWKRASLGGFVAAVVVIAGVVWFAPSTFQEAFGSNFLATLAGVAVGVPVTVWLTLREANEQGRALKTQDEARTAARRSQVLEALQTELTENKETLGDRRASGKREFFVPFLQDEVWAAMSDGGELRWIEDPALLRQLARSYLFIRTVIYLEKQIFEIRHYAGMRIQGSNPEGNISGYLDHLDGVCMAAIDEGLAAILAVQPAEAVAV
jgi:hypothetical protein